MKLPKFRSFRRSDDGLPFLSDEPIRSELFSMERLEQHAESLAAAQPVSTGSSSGKPLTSRLRENSRVLLSAYRVIAAAVNEEQTITPAAEWLVDNYHIVDDQIREIHDDLPEGFYRQLPKLTAGPLRGYPRVFGIAWAFIAHTDSRFDLEALIRFVQAYQRVQPLSIGELWAVAITIRVVLVENLRRLAQRIVERREERRSANAAADRLLGVGPHRAAQAMDSVRRFLVRPEERLVLLFTPPFDTTVLEPGYIKGYPPGIRENGGQYTHGAVWTAIAFAMLGEGDTAGEIFSFLNPIGHSRTPEAAERYKVEPYVISADVYSQPPHTGRGGWSWYTGSSGWMYRAGIESFLGFRQQGDTVLVDPCIPKHWKEFELRFRYRTALYLFTVENPAGVCRGIAAVSVDAVTQQPGPSAAPVCIPLNDDGAVHHILIRLGPGK